MSAVGTPPPEGRGRSQLNGLCWFTAEEVREIAFQVGRS